MAISFFLKRFSVYDKRSSRLTGNRTLSSNSVCEHALTSLLQALGQWGSKIACRGFVKMKPGGFFVNKEIFSTLYKALVRPILEYASPAWCPYLVKNIVLLEKVQRRASRLALGQRRGEMSYEDRCKLLRWSQLTDRRLYFSLIECYKLVFGLNSLCFRDFFEFASKRTRSNHNYKLQVKSANCNCYKYSFFVKIIREWNDLPANVVEVGNLRRFKIALKSYMCIS